MPTSGAGVYRARDYGEPALSLRLQVYDLLFDWTGKQDMGYAHLNALLGNKEFETPGHEQGNIPVMRALVGPNGYTVYKMLLIKRGMKSL